MNKLPLFLALAAFAVFFGCSGDKNSTTHAEHCEKTPLSKDCLVGKWKLDGVFGLTDFDCIESGDLELKSNGDYFFEGGVHNLDVGGAWEIDGNSITVIRSDLGIPLSGTVIVTESGNKMTVTTTEAYSVFADCNTDKREEFTWKESQ